MAGTVHMCPHVYESEKRITKKVSLLIKVSCNKPRLCVNLLKSDGVRQHFIKLSPSNIKALRRRSKRKLRVISNGKPCEIKLSRHISGCLSYIFDDLLTDYNTSSSFICGGPRGPLRIEFGGERLAPRVLNLNSDLDCKFLRKLVLVCAQKIRDERKFGLGFFARVEDSRRAVYFASHKTVLQSVLTVGGFILPPDYDRSAILRGGETKATFGYYSPHSEISMWFLSNAGYIDKRLSTLIEELLWLYV